MRARAVCPRHFPHERRRNDGAIEVAVADMHSCCADGSYRDRNQSRRWRLYESGARVGNTYRSTRDETRDNAALGGHVRAL